MYPSVISAAVLIKTGQALDLVHDIVMPKPGVGQLLVKIKNSGICHSQIMEADGARGEDKFLPHMLGHEAVGEVIDIGPEVTKFTSGEMAILGWIKGTGCDAGGTIYYSPSIGKVNAGPVTTFSNYALVSENRAYKMPKNTPEHLAFLYGCALPTGAGLVLNELNIGHNASIVIYGLGGIGLSALIACLHKRPAKLVAIDIEPSKLALAKELGASDVILASDPDLKNKIFSLTEGQGCDFAIEAAGKVETIEKAFSLIKKNGGQLCFASHPKVGETISIDPFELISGKKIMGSWGGGSNPDEDIPLLDNLYSQRKLNLENLAGKSYQLPQINEAMNDVRQRRVTRASISFNW